MSSGAGLRACGLRRPTGRDAGAWKLSPNSIWVYIPPYTSWFTSSMQAPVMCLLGWEITRAASTSIRVMGASGAV